MRSLHVDAGALRDQLVLQENELIEDGCGGFEDSWRNITICWARIMPAQANVRLRAEILEPDQLHLIDIRQPEMVVAGMRFSQSDPARIFEILNVFDPDETRRYWRCECRLLGQNT